MMMRRASLRKAHQIHGHSISKKHFRPILNIVTDIYKSSSPLSPIFTGPPPTLPPCTSISVPWPLSSSLSASHLLLIPALEEAAHEVLGEMRGGVLFGAEVLEDVGELLPVV